MLAVLSTLLVTISSPALAQEASDLKLLDERGRSPARTLSFGHDATAETRLIMADLAGWYGLALFEDDPDRVACLTGKEHIVRQLLRVMEAANRDLYPAVIDQRHAKVERESRQLRIALDRAQLLHRQGYECSQLVVQPIEPERRAKVLLPPAEDDLELWQVNLLRDVSAATW